jgi:hypothetical protein
MLTLGLSGNFSAEDEDLVPNIGNLYFEFQQAPAAHAPGFRSPGYVWLRGQCRSRLRA